MGDSENRCDSQVDACLEGGGAMGALMRAFDWTTSPVGPPARWPQSLRTAVSICLNSRFPIVLWWGPELTTFYNDGYIPIMGPHKHPRFLGRSGRDCWSEIWPTIGPMIDGVFREGASTWSEHLLLVVNRKLPQEEGYFTFSYGPIRDEADKVAGVFCAVKETTSDILAERRWRTLSGIGLDAALTGAPHEVCAAAMHAFEENPQDVPFALIYLIDADVKAARLAGATGLTPGGPAAPLTIALDDSANDSGWPLNEVLRAGRLQLLDGLDQRFGKLPGGPWPEPSVSAWLIPRRPSKGAGGLVLIAGLSPRLLIDHDYQAFVELAADKIAAAVTDARALEAERKRAEALAEIDRAKTTFFTNISHEFRTPLTLILGPLEALLAECRSDDESDRLRIIHRNALRLLRLVNRLLDFARIEAGRVRATFEPVKLDQLTIELASNFEPLAARAGLFFKIACEALPEPVYVDSEMWEKIVLNLISNAFKFTFSGGIRLTLRPIAEQVELRVSDTGEGIPAHHLPHLFDRFHRVEGTRSRSYEGSGIGLALIGELVKIHRGTIRVESEKGRGSSFIITLPFGHAHLPADQLGHRPEPALVSSTPAEIISEAARWLEHPTPELAGADLPTTHVSSEKRARILLIEDNGDMRDYLKRLLEVHYQIEAVADGAQGLSALQTAHFDLVLTDVMMPGLDGFTLLRKIREDPRTHAIPVIVVSARAGEDEKIEGLERGADDYIVKPFSARELIAKIDAQFQLARLREESRQLVRDREERLSLATQVAGFGVFEWDVQADRTFCNAQTFAIFGRAPDLGLPSFRQFLDETIHPADVVGFREQVARALPTGEVVEVRCRAYRQNDQSLRWLDFRLKTTAFEQSEPIRLIGVVADVTDHIHALEAEREARAEADRMRALADEASRSKDEFLAMLGHELRNPLSPIFTALKLMDLQPDSRTHQELAVIERQVNRMAGLVDDLLDISRVARGKIGLKKQQVELAAVVNEAIEMASPLIEQRSHQVDVIVPASGLVVDGDPRRLVQVVSNLLTNAAKYTNPGGRIEIIGEPQGDEVVLRVRDNGIGIRPVLLPNVFDLFMQGPRSSGRAEGGLGIGLALVRSFVGLHGGSVTADSAGEGCGSAFTIRLPSSRDRQGASEAITAARETAGVVSRRVMIVDDNEDTAETMAELLKSYGHVAKPFLDGPSALLEVEEFKPDVLLIDIGLPVMNGYELARRLRQILPVATARMIAVTGYGQDSDRQQTTEAGFDGHLVKPVDFAELRSLLENS